ncbi:class I SAM-dependent methyltransferase [Nocardia sp. NPDC127579]|uniref:class I SAM-dependent methyltransferase n=1 Tax=Nocardia sp. NPDC127579 TaxID=3345402 RepID=UPI0036392684
MESACATQPGVQTNPLPDGRASYHLLAERAAGAQRFLDIGCGDGALLALLAARGAKHLAGVDMSEHELAVAHSRPELADAALYLGRAEELPFADDSFDAVISHMALAQLPEAGPVVAETARVLAPNGRFVASMPARPELGSGYDLFFTVTRPLFDALPPEHHRADPCTRDSVDALLRPAGMTVIHWEEVTLGLPSPAADIWQTAVEKYCEPTLFPNSELDRLRAEFLDRATALAPADRLLPGERMSVATTELTPTDEFRWHQPSRHREGPLLHEQGAWVPTAQ